MNASIPTPYFFGGSRAESFAHHLTGDTPDAIGKSIEGWVKLRVLDAQNCTVSWQYDLTSTEHDRRKNPLKGGVSPDVLEIGKGIFCGHPIIFSVTGLENIPTWFTNIKPHIQKRLEILSILNLEELTQLYSARVYSIQESILNQNTDVSYAVLYFDIDNLKYINDTYGHTTGDALIAHFGACLKNEFRSESDIAIRKGGDEFCVIIRNAGDIDPAILEMRINSVKEAFQNIESLDLPISTRDISISSGFSQKPLIEKQYTLSHYLHNANIQANKQKKHHGKTHRILEAIGNTSDIIPNVQIGVTAILRAVRLGKKRITSEVRSILGHSF